MKKSELKFTGETYRLAPTSWGSDSVVMIDEDAAVEMMRACGFELESPDDDENDKPVEVEIATDIDGNFYAVQPEREKTSWGHRTGDIFPALYISCGNPAEMNGGVIEVGARWSEFDDEDGE